MQCIGLSCVRGPAEDAGCSESTTSSDSYVRFRFSRRNECFGGGLRRSRRLRVARSESGSSDVDTRRVRDRARSWVTRAYVDQDVDGTQSRPSALRRVLGCFAGVEAAVQMARGRDDLLVRQAQGVALDFFGAVDAPVPAPAICADSTRTLAPRIAQ